MVISLNLRKIKISLLVLFIIIFQEVNCFKPDSKKGDITQNTHKNDPNLKKECKTKERCRECTFDELKNMPECQQTGYKTLKHCSYYDENKKLVDEYYFKESCKEYMKINSVYWFLIICIIIGALAFHIRRSHKNFILNQTLEKLTILRKEN